MNDLWIFIILVIATIVIYHITQSSDGNDHKKNKNENFKNEDIQYAPYTDLGYSDHIMYDDGTFVAPNIGWLSRRGLLPWWNSTRDTKNMSYDLRGDIWPNYRYVGPWLNSSIADRPYRYAELY